MIQNGNVNTFMGENSLETGVDSDDLFYQGDSFSVDEYDQFFHNGKMDNGMDFGTPLPLKKL